MKQIFIIISLIIGSTAIISASNIDNNITNINGQRRKKKIIIPVDSFLRTYQFNKAIVQAEELIKEAEKKKEPTDSLNNLLNIARKGANMIRGTEKIMIIDSVVVSKKDLLNIIKVSKETGSIGMLENFVKQNNLNYPIENTTYFINDFKDKAYISLLNEDSVLRLNVINKINDKWTIPNVLKGLEGINTDQNYPFVTEDGITLYYSAKGMESLAGYDIYVTRYNTDTKKFVHPENVGMPYNSLANDYLMIIDEYSNLGWFVSDRYQPKDTACIYTFVPHTRRILVQNILTDTTALIKAAQMRSIKESWYDTKILEEARTRLKLLANDKETNKETNKRYFIINDTHVYFSLNEFRSTKAKALATQYIKDNKIFNKKKYSLDQYHILYHKTTDNKRILLKNKIISLEEEIENEKKKLKDLEKEIRQVEIQSYNLKK